MVLRKFLPANSWSRRRLRAGKVKRKFKEDIEPEEIFMDSKRLKEEPESEKEKLEKPIKQRVLKVFFVFVVLFLLFLLAKTFHLQIVEGDYWREMADENRIRSYPIEPLRGVIYDRNMTPLAINVPKLDLVVIPADLAKLDGFEDIKEKVKDNIQLTYPIIVEEDIGLERALLLEAQYADVPAVSIRKDSQREYEDEFFFSHPLGYLGKVNEQELEKGYLLDDYIGRDGIEKFYEDVLRGTYGEELVEIDNLGRIQKVIATKEAVSGQDLVLSIDADLQKQLYWAMRGRKGAAIALNPQNGKILALVSSPGFDTDNLVEAMSSSAQPLFNRAIAGGYPSGSTIKPLIAAAALEEEVISPDKQLFCSGSLTLTDKYNPNIFYTFFDWKEHGITNIYKAIAESCNVYFYTIGGGHEEIEGLGIERIKKYLELFGWGQELGIDLPGEKPGLIPSPQWKQETRNEEWYIGDTYNASIGQGDITASPLQVAMATAAIANGGKVFQPQLLENKKPKILKQDFIKEDFLEIVRKGMREAVIYGSAKALYDLPVKVAGKTGTAQVSKTKAPHAWFTAFAPYENPEIVITILIENGGEGSATALPVARQGLTWYFNQLLLKE
jgi:penicillin-binding protein 2